MVHSSKINRQTLVAREWSRNFNSIPYYIACWMFGLLTRYHLYCIYINDAPDVDFMYLNVVHFDCARLNYIEGQGQL